MPDARASTPRALAGLALALVVGGCAEPLDAAPERYRLQGTGEQWSTGDDDPLLVELQARYPAWFDVILDPAQSQMPDIRPLRDDLERTPGDRRNFDALNACAIAYFELNYRAQSTRGGETYLADSFRAAKVLAIPWRAYGGVDDPALRDAILDFFTDAASGEKLGTQATAPRLADVVGNLERKEPDAARRQRIVALREEIRANTPELLPPIDPFE